jgi:hypothetical protein
MIDNKKLISNSTPRYLRGNPLYKKLNPGINKQIVMDERISVKSLGIFIT